MSLQSTINKIVSIISGVVLIILGLGTIFTRCLVNIPSHPTVCSIYWFFGMINIGDFPEFGMLFILILGIIILSLGLYLFGKNIYLFLKKI